MAMAAEQESTRAEERRGHSEREFTLTLLRLLNDQNQTHELIRSLTGVLREWSGCEAVGVRLREGDDYPYFETRGFPPEFVRAENQLCQRDLDGQIVRDSVGNPVLDCMCGNILCGRFDPRLPFFTAHGSFWTNSTTDLLASTSEADRQARTRNRCNGEGYESVALVPLRHGKETLGLLQLNDHARGRFTPELIAFLENVGDQTAIALAQRKSQAALAASERRFRDVSAAAGEYLWETDAEARITFVSDRVVDILEYGPAELLGRTTLEFLDPAEVDRVREFFLNQRSSGTGFRNYEVRHLTKSGRSVWLSVTALPTFGPDGALLGYRGTAMEITERKEAEQALCRSQQELRIRNQIARAFLTFEGDETYREILRIVLATSGSTHGALAILGEEGNMVVPVMTPGRDAWPPLGTDAGQRVVFAVEGGGGIWQRAVQTRRAACAESPTGIPAVHPPLARAVCVPIVFQGAVIGVVGVGNKSTPYDAADLADLQAIADFLAPVLNARLERDRQEARRRTAEAALRESERHRLQAEKLAATARLAAQVAHEINNPLAGLKNCFQLIKDAVPADHPNRMFADIADREINRIADIVRRAYELHRPQQETLRRVRVRDTIREVATLLEFACHEQQVRLETAIEPADFDAYLPEGALRQVLYNLAANAIAASYPAGVVVIEALGEADKLRINVIDHGRGIPREIQDRIFEPFFSSNPAGPSPGLGLGLSISKSLVESCRGELDFESRDGATVFRLTLPCQGPGNE
jgi:PAS domain S-box-containing protein